MRKDSKKSRVAGQEAPFWHNLTSQEAIARLRTSEGGLEPAEARRRLSEHGPNELATAAAVSPWRVLFNQLKNLLIILLLIAATISTFLGHAIESAAIAVIVAFAILLGFIQEYRAERAIESLRKMTAPTATVIRGGRTLRLPARELVPGDVIVVVSGDRLPGDARIIDAMNLKVDESSLTGESVPVEKQCQALPHGAAAIGDRSNMLYSGTDVTYGRGRAVIVSTGMLTEFGKITAMLGTVEEERTPLQENLDRAGRALAVSAIAVVAVIVMTSMARGAAIVEMLVFGIALAVAVVPEALPAVVTISLALGVQRMARRDALVRHLPAVETLGSTSVICADKTGTLTQNAMTVRTVSIGGRRIDITGGGYEPEGEFLIEGTAAVPPPEVIQCLRVASLASDARIHREDGSWKISGDPTEAALIVAAGKAGLDKASLEAEWPRVEEIPFTSERARMTTLHRGSGGRLTCSKGAPEVIIPCCTSELTDSGERDLDSERAVHISEIAGSLAGEALRVLAVAYKKDTGLDSAEENMVFAGLLGMSDPPRPEVGDAIRTCITAGIKPLMITGDHPATAEAVARELGLLTDGRLATGAELDAMGTDELEEAIQGIQVYARVSPEHKLRVVDAWQKKQHVVAMTGDGVNDAPALRKADVGVAMGVAGTDVSREAADMTLTDDNFASIVGAVEEGRGIFANIKKYLMYLLSANIGEVGLMAGATLAGLPLPLTAVQILYVNLATDGLPALALSVDPSDEDLMRRPPRDPRRGIFTRPVVTLMAVGGVWSAALNLGLFTWALGSGRSTRHAMTMTFVSLVLIQLFKAYNFRSERHSMLKRMFANKWLNLAVLWEFALLNVIVYTPFLHAPFGTYTLSTQDWSIIGALSLSIIPVLEGAKWIIRRGWFGLATDQRNPP